MIDLGGIHRAAKEKYAATYFVLAHAIAFAWNILHPGVCSKAFVRLLRFSLNDTCSLKFASTSQSS